MKIFGISRQHFYNVWNIRKEYADKEKEELVLSGDVSNMSLIELEEKFWFLKFKSKAPKHIPHKTPQEAENFIIELQQKTWFWSRRMWYTIKAEYPELIDKYWLTYSRIKHIYERSKLRQKKYKTAKGTYRVMYNYEEIKPFSRLHYDVKYYSDESALPEITYKMWKELKLPLYVFNIIDVRTRFRFVGISDSKDSSVWFYFLWLVLQYLRWIWVDWDIKIWFDGWVEFTSWEGKKLEKWKRMFMRLWAECYVYDSRKDPRKNLIERSHLTDDVEFLVPFSSKFKTREEFIKLSKWWYGYYNFERPHYGVGMWGKSPNEKLKEIVEKEDLKINIEKLKEFPYLELDKHLEELMAISGRLVIMEEIEKNNKIRERVFEDRKKYIDFVMRFKDLIPPWWEWEKIVNYLLERDLKQFETCQNL